MSLDYQQVRQQVKELGEHAPESVQRKKIRLQQAQETLRLNANELERLHQKVRLAAQTHDPNLRCALPVLPAPDHRFEPLDGHYPLPNLPEQATILAADGSQIAPDRHAPVNYCLINIGAIQLRLGESQAPEISITSQLLYDDAIYNSVGMLTDARLALMRDLNERKRLAELATQAEAPIITFTDGPVELWIGKDSQGEEGYQEILEAYLDVLHDLRDLQVITAGYVDKPGANLVTRLLEIAETPDDKLSELRIYRPLRPVIDIELFRPILAPGERSAIFGLQSRSSDRYSGDLALHFFYLNVGREGHPWLARVEIPAWVAQNDTLLDPLHATLVQQCQVMGNRSYPYVLHRAHEVALVKIEEKEQVTQMIIMELRRRGVEVGEISHKQQNKDLGGKKAYRNRR